MARFRPLLRDHGLTEQQWRVLRVLAAEQNGEIDATLLAQRALLLAPSLSRILQFLQRRGYIARSADPQDQRRATFTLTEAGHKKFQEVAPDSERQYMIIEKQFGKCNLDALYKLLGEFETALTQDADNH